MRRNRSLLLAASTALVLFLVGGGVAVKIGAEPNRYDQPVIFAEIVALVLENYVDPVGPEGLVRGAYEGLLAGLDPNGAYLSPQEVAEWKAGRPTGLAGPGLTVLKGGRALQVVAVEPDSPAARAEIEVGDRIRSLDDRPARDLSLAQARRLLLGPVGSKVRIGLVRPGHEFSREELELERRESVGPAFELEVRDDVAVLTLRRLSGLSPDRLAGELEDVSSRGLDRLLIDLRNVADGGADEAVALASLFIAEPRLQLRDKSRELLAERVGSAEGLAWTGSVSVLVNGATAGGAEALASVLQQDGEMDLLGQSTFGYGAEADLIELRSGAGLLISVAVWETAEGSRWNETGLDPDREIVGDGTNVEEVAADQLRQAIELVREARPAARAA